MTERKLSSRRGEVIDDEVGMKSVQERLRTSTGRAIVRRGSREGRGPAREAPGRAHADHLTQHHPEVAAGDVHKQPFPDVGMSSKMDPSHPARFTSAGPPLVQIAHLLLAELYEFEGKFEDVVIVSDPPFLIIGEIVAGGFYLHHAIFRTAVD